VIAPLRLEAPAKLNLSLRVTGRRPDGFHELDSVFVLLELADRLILLPGCSGLRVEGLGAADLPYDEDNLAWRGLRAGIGGDPDLACLTLEKRIPTSAGLGGGSSDAAAAWRLGRAWRGLTEEATREDLADLSRIGADVPFFVARHPAARISGIGEVVEPLPPLPSEVLLVHPPFRLSTAAVFAELRPDDWGTRENDLLAPAARLRPELQDIADRIVRTGGEPRLTGSGPTLFTQSDDAERLDAVASALTGQGLAVTRTRTRIEPTIIEAISDDEEEAQQ
jgi:4-diphosphocytidyl-2-C-methyl-D-erythritol kinase